MNPLKWLRALTLAGKVAAAVAFLLLAIAAWWFLTEPGRQRARAAQAEAGQTIAEGDSRATEKAARAASDLAERTNDRNDLSRKNRDDILKAPGASDPVSPGVHDAQLRAQCLHDINRDDPVCIRLRKAGSP
jgi:hypothetical protein